MKNFTLRKIFYLPFFLCLLFSSNTIFAQSDECEDAPEIFDGSTPFSTVGLSPGVISTCSVGDIIDGWFLYTATCTGEVTVSTCNDASFDTALSVKDGCIGTEIACNDDGAGCLDYSSRMIFSSISGTQYWIRISGYGAAEGTGNLTISCIPSPPGGQAPDLCEDAIPILDGVTAFSTTGNTGTIISSCSLGDLIDGWYIYTASCSGTAEVKTCGDADFDTTLSAWDGCGGNEIACDDQGCGNESLMTFPVDAGTQYWIRIAGYAGSFGSGNLTISCSPISNDECNDAIQILDGITPFSTVSATGTDESSCTTGDTNDAWYVYIASCTGTLTVSTCDNADYDTSLSAFDGCGGTELACNDDGAGCADGTSEISLQVTDGSFYWIRISGAAGAVGKGDITITCEPPLPPNDECVNAVEVFSPSSTAGTTIGATTTGEPPLCIVDITSPGVWYTYESTSTETITADLCGAPYDSKISIYTGTCGNFTCVIGEDDEPVECGGELTDDPSVTFVSTANFVPVVYYIYVSGFDAEQGTFVLNLSGMPLPVTLTAFEGEIMENYNMLKWETASEENTAWHIIERSVDGRDAWETIGQAAAAGTSFENLKYELKDENPLSSAYYRVKSLDFDGQVDYSNIITLEREAQDFELISLAPNPANSVISMDFKTSGAGMHILRITNVVGQIMIEDRLNLEEGIHSKAFDVSGLSEGIYLITIENGFESLVHKIVKQ